jgi:hypothetical protein
VANPNPSPATRFGAGQPINLNGRPREASITARILARCAQDSGDGKTIAERIGDRFVAEALKGKFSFAKEVLDRVDGKVTERFEHSGTGGGPIVIDAAVRNQAEIGLDEWRKEQAEKLAELTSSVPLSMSGPSPIVPTSSINS